MHKAFFSQDIHKIVACKKTYLLHLLKPNSNPNTVQIITVQQQQTDLHELTAIKSAAKPVRS